MQLSSLDFRGDQSVKLRLALYKVSGRCYGWIFICYGCSKKWQPWSCTLLSDGHRIWTGVTKKFTTKNGCFEINSVLWASVQWYTIFFFFSFYFKTSHMLKIWFKLSRVNLYRNNLKGFKQKSLQVSMRFELAMVQVIRSQL